MPEITTKTQTELPTTSTPTVYEPEFADHALFPNTQNSSKLEEPTERQTPKTDCKYREVDTTTEGPETLEEWRTLTIAADPTSPDADEYYPNITHGGPYHFKDPETIRKHEAGEPLTKAEQAHIDALDHLTKAHKEEMEALVALERHNLYDSWAASIYGVMCKAFDIKAFGSGRTPSPQPNFSLDKLLESSNDEISKAEKEGKPYPKEILEVYKLHTEYESKKTDTLKEERNAYMTSIPLRQRANFS